MHPLTAKLIGIVLIAIFGVVMVSLISDADMHTHWAPMAFGGVLGLAGGAVLLVTIPRR